MNAGPLDQLLGLEEGPLGRYHRKPHHTITLPRIIASASALLLFLLLPKPSSSEGEERTRSSSRRGRKSAKSARNGNDVRDDRLERGHRRGRAGPGTLMLRRVSDSFGCGLDKAVAMNRALKRAISSSNLLYSDVEEDGVPGLDDVEDVDGLREGNTGNGRLTKQESIDSDPVDSYEALKGGVLGTWSSSGEESSLVRSGGESVGGGFVLMETSFDPNDPHKKTFAKDTRHKPRSRQRQEDKPRSVLHLFLRTLSSLVYVFRRNLALFLKLLRKIILKLCVRLAERHLSPKKLDFWNVSLLGTQIFLISLFFIPVEYGLGWKRNLLKQLSGSFYFWVWVRGLAPAATFSVLLTTLLGVWYHRRKVVVTAVGTKSRLQPSSSSPMLQGHDPAAASTTQLVLTQLQQRTTPLGHNDHVVTSIPAGTSAVRQQALSRQFAQKLRFLAILNGTCMWILSRLYELIRGDAGPLLDVERHASERDAVNFTPPPKGVQKAFMWPSDSLMPVEMFGLEKIPK